MADAITVEELELVITAKVEEAMKDIDTLIKHVKEKLSSVNLGDIKENVKSRMGGVGDTARAAKKNFEELERQHDRLNEKIRVHMQLYDALKAKFEAFKEKNARAEKMKMPLPVSEEVLARLGKQLFEAQSRIEDMIAKSDRMAEAMREAENATDGMAKNFGRTDTSRINRTINETIKRTKRVTEETRKYKSVVEQTTKKAADGFSKVGSVIKRLFFYGMLRRVISAVRNALTDGLQNIAKGSEKANAILSQYMTSFMYLKNAVASALLPILQSIAPYITSIVDKLADGFNYLSALISALTGQSTYTKAIKVQQDYADSLSNTADATKDVKDATKETEKALASLDEINRLSFDKGSGKDNSANGLSDASQPFKDMFTEEAIPGNIQSVASYIKNDLLPVFESVLEVAGAIGAAFLAWKIADGISSFISGVKSAGGLSKYLFGTASLVVEFGLIFDAVKNIASGKGSLWDAVKIGLGLAAGTIGATLMTGSLAAGFVIALGIGLIATVAGISFAFKEKDLRERFGDIGLTQEEIQSWVDKLTKSELAVSLNLWFEENSILTNLKTQVESAITKLDKYNFRIKIGMGVSQEDYMTAVDEFIRNSEEYLKQKHVVAALAVEILLDGTSTGTSLSEFVTTFYNTSYMKLNTLGEDLKKVVSEGFVDGVWIEDKFKEAVALEKEIQDILEYISTVEFKAKLTALKLDIKGTDLTPESFTAIMEQAQDTINGQLKNLEGIRLEALKIAQMEFDSSGNQEAYDEAIRDIEAQFNTKKLELSFETYNFGMETLKDAFALEVEKTIPILNQTTEQLFTSPIAGMSVLPEDTYDNIDIMFMQLRDAYANGFIQLDISKEARENMKDLIVHLQPTADQYEEVAKSALKTGESIPEEVSKGLHDINLLKAISGDMDAINYLLGEHLSTDSKFLDMLSTAQDAGKNVDGALKDGLLNNTQIVVDAANDTVTFINDTIGKKVVDITPTLKQNMKDLGIDISASLVKHAKEEIDKKAPEIFSTLKTQISNSKSSLLDVVNSLGTDLGSSLMKGFKNSVQNLKITSDVIMQQGVDSSVLDIMLKVQGYESGGFPETGQLFMAREAGPEYVGTMNGHTAVANNNQIVSGIEAGVFRAMSAVMGGNKRGDTFVIQLVDENGNVTSEKTISDIERQNLRTGVPLRI